MIACTIGGVSVLVANNSFSIVDALENRSILTLTVLDSPGTANYTRGQPVTFSDSVTGLSYNGYVNTSAPVKLGLASGFVAHAVTCMDKQYLLDKRTNSTNYLNWYAGDIATDFVDSTLAGEGVTAPYAARRDTTAANFNKGILSGVVGTSNVGDGDLELTLAGVNVTIVEDLTADFAMGTLMNVQASSNSLTPTSTTAISCTAALLGTVTGSFMSVKIWSGSMTVGTLDSLNYDIWIGGASPESKLGLDLYFSDGTKMSSFATTDQNNLPGSPVTDLNAYAHNTWYSRTITFPSTLNGKIINSVTITIAGTSVGTYTAYIKNAYLGSQSGNKFFAIGATTTNVSPPQIFLYIGYQLASVISNVVPVFIANNTYRISPAYTIDPVKLLRSSLIAWTATAISGISIYVSYDGGASYVSCTINAPLPALPVGTNVTGMTVTIKEVFTASGSTDPTIFPTLNSVNISLLSAPKATKTDIAQNYITAANWNTGTYTNTLLSGNNLTLGPTSRDWNDNLITNQTFTTLAGSPTQSASGGKYNIASPSGARGISSLDFAGVVADFVYDLDITVGSGSAGSIYYRNPTKTIQNGYFLQLDPLSGTLFLLAGTGPTTVAQVASVVTGGTTYHFKIVVTGSLHTIYQDGTLRFNVTDTTFTGPGYFVLGGAYVSSSTTCSFDNVVISPGTSGTWQSSAISISSLTACGLSAIYWTETNTLSPAIASILVQTSIDGGSSFQNCTNGGGIPNLTSGTNVTGKSIIVKATMVTVSSVNIPILSQMVWRVLGQYPGSTGTRSTVPLGFDTAIRANVGSGFGTGTDGQTYTQIGTATTNLTSNKLQITNTTGDVHMLYGSRVAGDCEGTVRFTLSASTMVFGMELHYGDVNNYYRFYASTTTLTIQKRLAGVSTTLQTAAMALSTGTAYWMRFRIVGSGPVNLYGKVWAGGILELTSWGITATDT
jgi:hypothetical protein